MYEPSYQLLQLSKTKYDGKHTSKQSYYQLKILLLFVATKSALFCCIRQMMYSMERQVYQVFLYSIVNLFATIFFMENITFHANDLQQEGTVQGCLVSNSDTKDSICKWAWLQAVFASAAVLLHSEHSLQPRGQLQILSLVSELLTVQRVIIARWLLQPQFWINSLMLRVSK